MAEAYSPSSTNRSAKSNLAVNLDVATRSSIVTAACRQLYNLKLTHEISDWRQRAADWDLYELIGRASDLGVQFRQGSEPFKLPMNIPHR